MSVNLTASEFSKLDIIRRPRIERIRQIENGDIPGAKNNFIWRQVKTSLNSGFLLVLLGLDQTKVEIINHQLKSLTKCHNKAGLITKVN